MPSKPGYEPLSQAKPSRHLEVARLPAGSADRSYGKPAAGRDLEALGVRTVAIPRKAKVSPARRAAEHARGFRGSSSGTPASKAGSATSSRYGWDRTRLDGRGGAAIWCAHGDFAHNLVKFSALAN